MLRLSIQTLLMRILILFYNQILQIITLQCVGCYKQKTPRMDEDATSLDVEAQVPVLGEKLPYLKQIYHRLLDQFLI